MKGLRDIEDLRPLPGIEWALTIDREQAGRFGADVGTIGAAVQLITNGIKVGEYRPDDAEDEIDIRVRYPIEGRGISALDQLYINTREGAVPITNFVKRTPQQQAAVQRVDGLRIWLVRERKLG
jgi:multidrug efflux pump